MLLIKCLFPELLGLMTNCLDFFLIVYFFNILIKEYILHNIFVSLFKYLECTEGAIRLRDGQNDLEGRIEVCLNGTWGTVCHDYWSGVDSLVVCRQLGYSDKCMSYNLHIVYNYYIYISFLFQLLLDIILHSLVREMMCQF